MKAEKTDMLHGPVFKGILALAIPIMIMNVGQNLLNALDMVVVGNMIGDYAVGAVGVSGSMISLIIGLAVGASLGANVVLAKTIGEGDRKAIEKVVSTSVLLSVIFGVLIGALAIIFSDFLLEVNNCPEELFSDAKIYFIYYFASLPFLMLYNFSSALMRSTGDTKRPMYFMLIMGAMKLVLSVIFIKLGLKVSAVGVATLVSQAVIGILSLAVIVKSRHVYHYDIKKTKIYKKELGEILFIGIPAGLQQSMYSLANVVITATVNSFGEAAATGLSIANQYDGILYQIATAPAHAATPYIAQNLGAKNMGRAKKAVWYSMAIAILFAGTLGALSAILSPWLSSFMSKDPEVIMYSCQKMVIVSSTYFICGINEIMNGTMRGYGKPIVPTVNTFLFMCVFRFVWVYAIFPFVPQNVTFLYLVWPIGWVLAIISNLIFYIPARRKLEREIKENV